MGKASDREAMFGELLALVVGIGLVLGGVLNRLLGGAMMNTTVLILIGAGALSGYVRARQKRRQAPPE